MSKKDDAAPTASATPAGDTKGASKKSEAPYRTGKWLGRHTNYQCTACSYATLSKADIEEHVRVHRDRTQKRAR